MIEIVNQSVNPYFNIAVEEYLLKNFDCNCFMLWQNTPSLIVGKHQNTLAEINLNFVEKNDIKVVRRISGGGTVYHDLGNLNFTFVTNHNNNQIINFDLYLSPIKEVLNNIGINVTTNKRNNLFIDQKKISGTAAHIYKNKIIHHGTLLFSTNILNLQSAIKTNYENFGDKSIKSVNNVVTNINEHLKNKISLNEFAEKLRKEIYYQFNCTDKYIISETDFIEINKLVKTKYKTWNWNYGYSPYYKFSKSHENKLLSIDLNVKNGIIENIKINIDLEIENIKIVENKIIGVKHSKNDILSSILEIKDAVFFNNISVNEFVDLFF